MEDEEDDLYGSAQPNSAEQAPANDDAQVKTEQMDVSEEEEDSEDVRDLHRISSKAIHSLILRRAGHPDHHRATRRREIRVGVRPSQRP